MTPEERFTKIENYLGAIVERQAQHEEEIGRLQGTLETVIGVVSNLAIAQERTVNNIERLAEQHEKLAEQHEKLQQRLADMADRQDHGDFKLNALIDAVEKILRKFPAS